MVAARGEAVALPLNDDDELMIACVRRNA